MFVNASFFVRILLFLILFILIVTGVRFLGWFLTKIIDIFPLNLMNRLLGGTLGLLKAVLVFWLFLFLYLLFIPKASATIARSPLSYALWQGGLYVVNFLPQDWKKILKERPKEERKSRPDLKRVVWQSQSPYFPLF